MALDLFLVTADAGPHPQTSQLSLETLSSTHNTEETVDDGTLCSALPTEERFDDKAPHTNMNWLDPLPAIEATRIKRHTDVPQVPRYILQSPSASYYDGECIATPSRIPPWVLPPALDHMVVPAVRFSPRVHFLLGNPIIKT